MAGKSRSSSYAIQRKLFVEETRWTDRELAALASALQTYGFSETRKIAEVIKTKNENAVACFISQQITNQRRKTARARASGRVSEWNNPTLEDLKKWPTIRKWRKLAFNQMMKCTREQDYSKIAMMNLCKKFYEEEEEPSDNQVLNIKSIYKYILDCMTGRMPAELPPLESAMVHRLLMQLEEMVATSDFSNEESFVKDFRKAQTFRPFRVKDEFLKKAQKNKEDDPAEAGAFPVEERIFSCLSRHRKLVQSFNPMVVPVWLIDQRQGQLTHMLTGAPDPPSNV